MHEKKWIDVDHVKQEFYYKADHRSLLVLFPGMGYTCDKPLLYYAKKAGFDCDFDVLCLHYGDMKFDKSKVEASILPAYKISRKAVHECMQSKQYDAICFISKSLGTILAARLTEEISQTVHNIYLTPLRQTLKHRIDQEDALFYGDHDPMIDSDTMNRFEGLSCLVTKFKKADHSLEVAMEGITSVEYLRTVVQNYYEFLNKYKQ